MTLNNFDIAVLAALNELGRRFGLQPFDLDASLHIPKNGPEVRICFSKPPQEANSVQYWKMIKALGIAESDGPELSGTEEAVWNAVQAALRRAPNPIGRA